MINRPIVVAALASGMLLSATLGQWTPAQAAKKPTVKIGKAAVNPKTLPGNGGTVSISVKINPQNGAVVNSVAVRSTVTGSTAGPGPSSTLQSTGNGTFTGNVRIPSNGKKSKVAAYIDVEVNSSAGLFFKKRAAKVTLGAAVPGSDGPPPPPDI